MYRVLPVSYHHCKPCKAPKSHILIYYSFARKVLPIDQIAVQRIALTDYLDQIIDTGLAFDMISSIKVCFFANYILNNVSIMTQLFKHA